MLYPFCNFYFLCRLQQKLLLVHHTGSRMSKGLRKAQQQTEEIEEDSRSPSGRGEPVESEMVAMFRLRGH